MRPILLAFFFAAVALAEEAHGATPDLTLSKWIHFGVLFLLLAYGWTKMAVPAFRARREQIAKDLADARTRKADSDQRVAEIERRLGNLSGEIQAFQAESKRMIEAEGERLRVETARLLERVQAQTAAEIESISKAIRGDVKREAAQLAVRLASDKIAQGLSPEIHGQLLREFAGNLAQARKH